jgi:hypothetical protein
VPALALLAGLAAYPALATDRLGSVVGGVAIAAVVAFAAGLAGRWAFLLACGPVGFGAEYAVFLRLRGDEVDSRAPFLAALVLLATELAFESISADGTAAERDLIVRQGLAVAGAVVLTALVGGLVLVLATTANSGLVLEAVGVIAAVAAVALLVRVGTRAREPG